MAAKNLPPTKPARPHRIGAVIGDELWVRLNEEAARRSTPWHKVSASEVLRQLLAEKLGAA